jgi:hypothetical protein
MHVFGQSGVDLYTDNTYIGTAIHGETTGVEHVYFKEASPEYREHVLYLPLYNGLRVKAIGGNLPLRSQNEKPYNARAKSEDTIERYGLCYAASPFNSSAYSLP